MVDQKEEAKMEKFIETMPIMIQTYIIICKDWEATKEKAKSLEHIIHKCDPPAAAMPLITTGAAVPGLHSHVAHSIDKDETEIPPPFKEAIPKQNRGGGKSKDKPWVQRQNPPKDQDDKDQYACDSTNNYYHNDSYSGNGQSRGHRPFNSQSGGQQFQSFNPRGRSQRPNITFKIKDNFNTKDITGTIIKVTTISITTP